MSRASPIQTNFTAGELSPRLAGRVDLGKYRNGARRLENVIVHPHGGVSRRPGTRFVAAAQYCDRKARLVPFVFSAQQAHVLEFGHRYIRVFDRGAAVPAAGGMDSTASPINRLAGEVVSEAEGGGAIADAASAFSGDAAASAVFHAGGIGKDWTCGNTKTVVRFRITLAGSVPAGAVGWRLQGSEDGAGWDDLTTVATALDVTVGEPQRAPYAFHRVWFDFGTGGGDNTRAVQAIEFFGPGPFELPSPYAEDELAALQFAQSADVLFLTHPDHPPRRLNRYGIDQWELVEMAFAGGPFLDTVVANDVSKIPAGAGTLASQLAGGGAIGNAANAFDDDAGTATSEFDEGWLRQDWGGGNARTISRYRLNLTGFGAQVTLAGSDDGASWTELHTVSRPFGLVIQTPIEVSAGIDTARAYRYHRFAIEFGDFQGGP